MESIDQNEWLFEMEKNDTIILYNKNYLNELLVEVVENQLDQANVFGLNERFVTKRKYLKAFQFEGR